MLIGHKARPAAKLCEADLANIFRPKGDSSFLHQASYGFSQALKDYLERTPIKPGRGSAIGRALLERAPVHIPDAQADPITRWRPPRLAIFTPYSPFLSCGKKRRSARLGWRGVQ